MEQFSLGFYFFVDASTYSHSAKNGSDVHINFVDWIPGICSALGMLVINSIEKSRLSGDSFYSGSGSGVAWKARLVLFLGFALMAGGLAGSVVCPLTMRLLEVSQANTVFEDCPSPQICRPGISVPNPLFRYSQRNCQWFYYVEVRDTELGWWMTLTKDDSSVVLWISQNMEDDYTYNLAL